MDEKSKLMDEISCFFTEVFGSRVKTHEYCMLMRIVI